MNGGFGRQTGPFPRSCGFFAVLILVCRSRRSVVGCSLFLVFFFFFFRYGSGFRCVDLVRISLKRFSRGSFSGACLSPFSLSAIFRFMQTRLRGVTCGERVLRGLNPGDRNVWRRRYSASPYRFQMGRLCATGSAVMDVRCLPSLLALTRRRIWDYLPFSPCLAAACSRRFYRQRAVRFHVALRTLFLSCGLTALRALGLVVWFLLPTLAVCIAHMLALQPVLCHLYLCLHSLHYFFLTPSAAVPSALLLY